MSTHSASRRTVEYVAHHAVELLTLLVLLFVLQAGLIPFDFTSGSAAAGASRLFGADTSRFTLPDILSNILLYVPLGILLHYSVLRRVGSATLGLLVVIVLGSCLSAGIEFLQAFSPSRVSSIIDLVSNIIGTAAGGLISWFARWIVPRFVAAAADEFHRQPKVAAVKSYVCVLILFAALPFSFSFDSIRLKQCVKAATWTPFGMISKHVADADAAFEKDDVWACGLARWSMMKRWSRWSAECVSFALLAWLLHAVLKGVHGFSRRGTTALIWWSGGGLAIGLSLLQLPILTRGFDVTDILFRWMGLGVGLLARSIHTREANHLSTPDRALLRQRRVRWAFRAVLLYIVYNGLIPLTLDSTPGVAARAVTSQGFLPFFAYFVTRFDLMMDDVMEKFCSFALLAALLVAARPRLQARSLRSRVLTMGVTGACISAVIEIVQMFIPVRITTMSDPIVAALGCAVGVFAREYAVSFYQFATSVETQARPSRRAPELAPADELVATLMDPQADAPVEPTPAKPAPVPPHAPRE